ncbi:hypothetical protein P154DRAFT_608166 [Amniculicola lignicola CBS 123094]|uniref:Uncharacterized protein n=1 Tax=Amniculicola lignicola CBS 123094 TaxID=1392246 RepID=A0A6A5WFW0_9PLEO|nr:hypothetical protein P154DRAFT_608166 [Amniculicola lignicola CBS 123094]
MATSITPRRSVALSPSRPVTPSPEWLPTGPHTPKNSPSPEPHPCSTPLRRHRRTLKRPGQQNMNAPVINANMDEDMASKLRQQQLQRPETPTPMTPAQRRDRFTPLGATSTAPPKRKRPRNSGIMENEFVFPPRSPIPTDGHATPSTTSSRPQRTSHYGLPPPRPQKQNAAARLREGTSGRAGLGLGYGPGPILSSSSESLEPQAIRAGAGLAFGVYTADDLLANRLAARVPEENKWCCCTVM